MVSPLQFDILIHGGEPSSASATLADNGNPVSGNYADSGIGRFTLIWTCFVVLLALWAAGVVVGDSFGGALHLLLLGAIALLFLETLSRSRRARG
jgi:hypothetical protein